MTYEAIVYFDADSDAVADELFDSVCDALGCTDDPDHECPHFRLGFGPLKVPETRRAALRRCFSELRMALAITVRGV